LKRDLTVENLQKIEIQKLVREREEEEEEEEEERKKRVSEINLKVPRAVFGI